MLASETADLPHLVDNQEPKVSWVWSLREVNGLGFTQRASLLSESIALQTPNDVLIGTFDAALLFIVSGSHPTHVTGREAAKLKAVYRSEVPHPFSYFFLISHERFV